MANNATSDATFDGIWLPMVTPFRDGSVDVAAASNLAKHYEKAGIRGLVLFGSTGEGNLLSVLERRQITSAVYSACPKMPVLLGVGACDTRAVLALIEQLEDLNPAGYLSPAPYYLGPAQDGIQWHYEQLATSTRRAIVAYDVPKRTGVSIAVETVVRLARARSIAAIKACDPQMMRALSARRVLPVLCGDDSSLLEHFQSGGSGAIPACAHIFPDRFVRLLELSRGGRLQEARELFNTLAPMTRLLFAEPSPAPVKRLLARMHLIQEELRLPMTRVTPECARVLDAIDLSVEG